jgi:hypothetical protein
MKIHGSIFSNITGDTLPAVMWNVSCVEPALTVQMTFTVGYEVFRAVTMKTSLVWD